MPLRSSRILRDLLLTCITALAADVLSQISVDTGQGSAAKYAESKADERDKDHYWWTAAALNAENNEYLRGIYVGLSGYLGSCLLVAVGWVVAAFQRTAGTPSSELLQWFEASSAPVYAALALGQVSTVYMAVVITLGYFFLSNRIEIAHLVPIGRSQSRKRLRWMSGGMFSTACLLPELSVSIILLLNLPLWTKNFYSQPDEVHWLYWIFLVITLGVLGVGVFLAIDLIENAKIRRSLPPEKEQHDSD